MPEIYLEKISIYKPSASNPDESPKLEFVDSLLKRRLSQISRMTVHVVHEVVDAAPEGKIVFVSFRGEISRQLKINEGLVEDGDVMPAGFSISVFNTPPAVTSIALKLKAGYTAIYPSSDDFKNAFISAAAALADEETKKIIFVYADEHIPTEYMDCIYNGKSISVADASALAFACVLTNEKPQAAKSTAIDLNHFEVKTPEDFIEQYAQKILIA